LGLAILIFVIDSCSFAIVVIAKLLALSNRWDTSNYWPSPEEDEISSVIYRRQATVPRDMAFSVWPVLQKLTSSKLRTPHYGSDLDEIYWKLTVPMIQLTESLSSLYLAAVQSLPGAPSWVPDWSAHGTQQWSSRLSRARGFDKYGKSYWLDGPDSHRRRTAASANNAHVYIRLDRTRRVLTVRARQLCKISMIALFRQTSETVRDGESSLHLENFRLLQELSCTFWPLNNSRPFPYNLLHILEIDPEPFLGKQKGKVSKWARFCRKNCIEDPLHIMMRLKSRNSHKYEVMLSTQIMLSNSLAQGKKMLSRARSSLRIGIEMAGVCYQGVRVGDDVVQISGVSQSLIVRDRQQEERSVEIVSPASVGKGHRWLGVKMRGIYLQRPTDVELDERFVKYRIY
jgi:hypothetical protein